MRTHLVLLVCAAVAGCTPASAPDTAEPVQQAASAVTVPAQPAASASPAAPEAPIALPSSAPAASAAAPTADACEQLASVCHDVGHSGGEPDRCHQLGHAREEAACAKDLKKCLAACEAAAKAPGHKHAH